LDNSTLLKGQIVWVGDPNSTESDKANSNELVGTYTLISTKTGMTAQNYYKKIVNSGHNYANYKKISNREFSVNGTTAYEIVYTNKMENGKTGKTREVILERNGKIYVIDSVSINEFDKNTANFDMIINSFQVQ